MASMAVAPEKQDAQVEAKQVDVEDGESVAGDDERTDEVNPFVNKTFKMGWCEFVKCIIMCLLLIPLFRFIIIVLTLLVLTVYLRIVICCCRRTSDKPLSAGMKLLLLPVNWGMRLILLCCGVWWVEETYPDDRCCGYGYLNNNSAPRILVPTHATFLEGLYFGARCIPVAVAKASLGSIPVIGPVFRSLNPILVPRTPKERARLPNVVDAIVTKATAPPASRYPPILLFPEGTTVQQETIIKFQRGAFLPKQPVSPVIISYPYTCLGFDVSWTPEISPLKILFRCLCSVYVRMKVKYMAEYTPSDEEKEDPDLFADNVCRVMAKAGNRTLCRVSNYDGFLWKEATKRSASLGSYAFRHLIHSLETKEAMKVSRRHYSDLLDLARLFKDADVDTCGKLTLTEFESLFRDTESLNPRLPEVLFAVLDKNGDDVLDWQELVAAIGGQMEDMPADRLADLAFTMYSNADDVVSAEDMKRVMRGVLKEEDHEDLNERVDDLVEFFDTNKDGFIDRSEFSAMAAAKPVLVSGAIRALLKTFGVALPRGAESTISLSPRALENEVMVVEPQDVADSSDAGAGVGAGAGAGVGAADATQPAPAASDSKQTT